MGKPTDTRLTPEIAREVCQRMGSTAVLDGSIAEIGTQYSVILKAVNCANGESLTSTEAQASDKSHVLDTLGNAASVIRNKLGESLSTVQKFNTPNQPPRPSKHYRPIASDERPCMVSNLVLPCPCSSGPSNLDPNFAMAHASLGTCYGVLGETSLAAESTKKDYELRAGVSEREKLYLESHYATYVTGDLEKSRKVYELWEQVYPRRAATCWRTAKGHSSLHFFVHGFLRFYYAGGNFCADSQGDPPTLHKISNWILSGVI
jgi:hypothetical protein